MNTTKEIFRFDKAYNKIIAGVDEAGRGPLAGPVVCAACIMPLDRMIEGINDSKAISEKNREKLYDQIIKKALSYSVSVIASETIDEINILRATKKGMNEAVGGLKISVDLVLVDAVSGLDIKYAYESLIKGDAKSYNIACASIIAKVTRDKIMREMDAVYPDYGFSSNKGYGTKQHIEALKKFGATPIHRKLFIRNALSEQLEFMV